MLWVHGSKQVERSVCCLISICSSCPVNGITQAEKCRSLNHPQVEQGQALGGDGWTLELKLHWCLDCPNSCCCPWNEDVWYAYKRESFCITTVFSPVHQDKTKLNYNRSEKLHWDEYNWVYQAESCGHPWVDHVCQTLGVEWPVEGVEETPINGNCYRCLTVTYWHMLDIKTGYT